jgi:hypothetical protein
VPRREGSLGLIVTVVLNSGRLGEATAEPCHG